MAWTVPAAGGLDVVTDPERTEDQDHDARREIGQGVLKCQANREAGGAEHANEARGLDAELREHGKHSEREDHVPGEAGRESPQRGIHRLEPGEGGIDSPVHPSGEHPSQGQDDDPPKRTEPVRDDEEGGLLDQILRRGSRSARITETGQAAASSSWPAASQLGHSLWSACMTAKRYLHHMCHGDRQAHPAQFDRAERRRTRCDDRTH